MLSAIESRPPCVERSGPSGAWAFLRTGWLAAGWAFEAEVGHGELAQAAGVAAQAHLGLEQAGGAADATDAGSAGRG